MLHVKSKQCLHSTVEAVINHLMMGVCENHIATDPIVTIIILGGDDLTSYELTSV